LRPVAARSSAGWATSCVRQRACWWG
jgi:hypothetical protein